MVPSTRVTFSPEDKAEILQRIAGALDKGFLAQGATVAEFESRFAAYVGTKHAIATANGGAALELTLRYLRIDDADVLVPANTFAATAMSILLAGGRPRFVDLAADTLSPTVEQLERAVTDRTAGVVVVHIGGIISAAIEEITAWCSARGLWLIEDCAHSHGSTLGGKSAGTFGRAGCYSFFATKTMTSGEGGMIVTDDDELARAARIMRDYGKPEPWVSIHTMIGGNWRMNELEAAVGVVQLARLDEMIASRESIAAAYDQRLDAAFGEPLPRVRPRGRSSWYKYIVLLPVGTDRNEVKARMRAREVHAAGGVFDVPLHRQPVFAGEPVVLPNTDRFCDRHLCLPIYFGMADHEVESVVHALADALHETSSAAARLP